MESLATLIEGLFFSHHAAFLFSFQHFPFSLEGFALKLPLLDSLYLIRPVFTFKPLLFMHFRIKISRCLIFLLDDSNTNEINNYRNRKAGETFECLENLKLQQCGVEQQNVAHFIKKFFVLCFFILFVKKYHIAIVSCV